jgi:hypothetical protein
MTTANKNLEAIFHEALALTNESERAGYLDLACPGDAKFRAEVEALIRFHSEAGEFLEVPVFNLSVAPGL